MKVLERWNIAIPDVERGTFILRMQVERKRMEVHITNFEPMTAQIEPKQLWIGLVEVRPLKGCDILDGASGAFVNIVTWADNAEEYRRNAELVLGELSLFIVGVENPEPVNKRRRRDGDFEEAIEDIIARAEENPNAIIYSTFHTYEKDDA